MPCGRQELFCVLVTGVLLLPMLGTRAEACGLLLRITYAEDYPDWFHIEFLEGDGYTLQALQLNLGTAVGRPLIDTAYPQSRHSEWDGVVITGNTGFVTGSRDMGLGFAQFTSGKKFTLLVDLDGRFDQLRHGELFGAEAKAKFVRSDGTSLQLNGRFDADGVAELGNRACA